MKAPSTRLVARLLWALPVFLLLLAFQQAKTAYDLRHTLRQGERAVAEVTKVHISHRVDVTYDYVNLRVTLDDGRVIERENLSLPHTLITFVKGEKTVPVRILPGAAQELVIASVADSQWRIAALQAAMAAVAALLFGGGVFAWNRFLKRKGDPALRNGGEEEERTKG